MKAALRILRNFILAGILIVGHVIMYGSLSTTIDPAYYTTTLSLLHHQEEEHPSQSSSSSSYGDSQIKKNLEMPPLLPTKVPVSAYEDNNTVAHAPDDYKNGIPKVIYIFWEQGWDHNQTSAIARLAFRTWKVLNPDFKVVALDGKMAEAMTKRSAYIDDSVWSKSSVQARSDVYRTLLLYHYGGVWVDASLYCTKPLSVWLDLQQQDMFAFLRRGIRPNLLKLRQLYPWVASWFLASPPHSYTTASIIQTFQSQPHRILSEYNWWHRIVMELTMTSDYLSRRVFSEFPAEYAVLANTRLVPDAATVAPFFKRAESARTATAYLVSQTCCRNMGPYAEMEGFTELFNNDASDDAFVQQHVCPDWNCTHYGRNFAGSLPHLDAYFTKKRAQTPSIFGPPFDCPRKEKSACHW